MRVGQLRIERQGLTIRGDRFGFTIQVLQQYRQIECQQRFGLVGRTIDLFRVIETPGDVQQAAQIDSRLDKLGLNIQAGLVRGLRGRGVAVLQFECLCVILIG